MGTTTLMTVEAEIMYDPCHLVGQHYDEETGDLSDVEEGRWIIFMEAPDGVEFTRVAKSAARLVEFADRWGKDRGVPVTIKFLNTVGG